MWLFINFFLIFKFRIFVKNLYPFCYDYDRSHPKRQFIRQNALYLILKEYIYLSTYTFYSDKFTQYTNIYSFYNKYGHPSYYEKNENSYDVILENNHFKNTINNLKNVENNYFYKVVNIVPKISAIDKRSIKDIDENIYSSSINIMKDSSPIIDLGPINTMKDSSPIIDLNSINTMKDSFSIIDLDLINTMKDSSPIIDLDPINTMKDSFPIIDKKNTIIHN